MGRGIHNPNSHVCGAAIADGSLPKSGGCIGVSRLTGLDGYAKALKTNGVKVDKGPGADWSFITFKVDNPDFAKSDIRILVNIYKIII